MNNKALSRRTNTLLMILVIISLIITYYLLVYKVVEEKKIEIELKTQSIEKEIIEKEFDIQEVDMMKRELKEMESAPKAQMTELPNFDNTDALLLKLEAILSPTIEYSLEFSDIETIDDIVRRKINIKFNTNSYVQVSTVIDEISNIGYRFIIDEFQFSIDNSVGKYFSVIGITFFEHIE